MGENLTHPAFKLERTRNLPPPLGQAREFVHILTGARVLHICNDDPENLFCIAFPTPPPDDTGLPHILEHAVLAGSRKYPVKDPFFEMVKTSVGSFINAITFWDRTVYPVSSNVKQDLFNLADVYLDAVFHPLLTEQTFKREGVRLAVDGDSLTYSGVVFNEMKGAWADPEQALGAHVQRYLFPDVPHGREAGGDPRRIPDLTYERFRDFHAEYYRPGRALFILYGNIPTTEYLDFLARHLTGFGPTPPVPCPPRQPRWSETRTVTETYAINPDEPSAGRTYLTLTWLVGDATDPRETALWFLLTLLLFGHDAAPLKAALVDSHLGEDVFPAGADAVGPELIFHVGLKGSEADRLPAFEELTLKELRRLSEESFPSEAVDAAFHQAAYEYLEIRPGFPLQVAFRVAQSWVYGGDPVRFLLLRDVLGELADEARRDPGIWSRLIRERLLENPHRLNLILRPDPDHDAKLHAYFSERLRAIRERLSTEELQRLAEESAALEREATLPNPPEALARLPHLKLDDLPARPPEIPCQIQKLNGHVPFLVTEVPANGVAYVVFDVEISDLPAEHWLYVPLFAQALTRMGAGDWNFEVVARLGASRFGVFHARPWLQYPADGERPVLRLTVEIKTLDERINAALELLEKILFELNPRDRERLRDILVQTRAWERTEIVHNGTHTPLLHAARGLSLVGYLRELCSGLPQLVLFENLVPHYEEQADVLMARLETLRDFLLCARRWAVSCTAEAASVRAVESALRRWLSRMRTHDLGPVTLTYPAYTSPVREGLAAPLTVAHCAMVQPAPPVTHPDSPLLEVAAHLITHDYMLPEVRFRGHAYGAGCRYSSGARQISLTSYRDPRPAATLSVFEGVLEFVNRRHWTTMEIEQAILGACKDDLRPARPAEATLLALGRYLCGMTPDVRAEYFQRKRLTTAGELKRAMLRALEEGRDRRAICVLASRQQLEEANRHIAEPLSIEDIPLGEGPES